VKVCKQQPALESRSGCKLDVRYQDPQEQNSSLVLIYVRDANVATLIEVRNELMLDIAAVAKSRAERVRLIWVRFSLRHLRVWQNRHFFGPKSRATLAALLK
jgi:hypothetical protein